MSDGSAIEWCDATWSVTRGCSRVSEGCRNCYAERMAHRFSGPGKPYEGLTRQTKDGPRWTGEVRLIPEALDLPLRWKKPRRVFVDSMSDLFHEKVPDGYIAAVFGVMAACPQHTFIVLTKRAERMRRWFGWMEGTIDPIIATYAKEGLKQRPRGYWYAAQTIGFAENAIGRDIVPGGDEDALKIMWPLPNVLLGVSVEDQRAADERIPILLAMPAALRWISAEPLLGPVDLRAAMPCGDCGERDEDHGHGCRNGGACEDEKWLRRAGLGWCVVGGESGPGARPMNENWVRSIRDQCIDAGVPLFYKQRLDPYGHKESMPMLDGRTWDEMPEVHHG